MCSRYVYKTRMVVKKRVPNQNFSTVEYFYVIKTENEKIKTREKFLKFSRLLEQQSRRFKVRNITLCLTVSALSADHMCINNLFFVRLQFYSKENVRWRNKNGKCLKGGKIIQLLWFLLYSDLMGTENLGNWSRRMKREKWHFRWKKLGNGNIKKNI